MKALIRSFGHAGNGIVFALRHERNFQIEVVAAVVVLALMLIYPINILERAVVLSIMALVLSLELLNTALEHFLDLVKPDVSPVVKIIKDLVAGSVLLSSFFALLIGFLVFLPYLA